jgi:hypothetical protein
MAAFAFSSVLHANQKIPRKIKIAVMDTGGGSDHESRVLAILKMPCGAR